VSATLELGPGDQLVGTTGSVVTRGPASYGVPLVKIRPAPSVWKIVNLNGANVQVAWVDLAGGQAAIGAGDATATARIEFVAIHDTTRVGIGQMRGKLLHSHLYANGLDPDLQGFSAAAVKGVDEYEAAFNFVHDNPANGLWCDQGCIDEGAAMPNGFWAHDNLLVNNGRWGVRYEFSPIVASGARDPTSTALIERNEIHGNGYKEGASFGGASMWDAQNATFRGNVFGPKTIAGVAYRANAGRVGILFNDSGRADRTDLWNGDAVANTLGGDTVVGCSRPDAVVLCANNK